MLIMSSLATAVFSRSSCKMPCSSVGAPGPDMVPFFSGLIESLGWWKLGTIPSFYARASKLERERPGGL
ncbi:hypothetical protein MRB53_030470 [Persea americana]|uniref:Uncharacterized protein n=1 Tax=Persea americana TaxID=3435 RepID=A0ACC2KLB8_PERAE|nr:hypothetical protein MRB53_030470 [Persea americana]